MALQYETPMIATIHPPPVISWVQGRLRKNLLNIDSTRNGFFLDFQLLHFHIFLDFQLLHLQENLILHGTRSYYKSLTQNVPPHASLSHNCEMPRSHPSCNTHVSSTAPPCHASLSVASMSDAPDTVVIDDDSTISISSHKASDSEKPINPKDVLGK